MALSGWTLLLLSFLLLAPVLAEKSKCKVCRDLTDAVSEHLEKTVGHNFGGGNTAWEEKSLGVYATSETRLVEILEKTAKKCDYKCGSLLEDQEEFIEEWFFKRQDKDIFTELCVDHLKRCCPKNTWGPDCAECPGGTTEPCSGRGKCKGEGDRAADSKLTGTCTCDKGYNGTLCDSCKEKFIRIEDGSCEACSSLCKGQCTAPGPEGCERCIQGYELVEQQGCTDINECEREGCGDPLEECVNSPGSYECVCKAGYTRVSGKCQLEDLYAEEDEDDETGGIRIEEGDITSDDTDTEPVGASKEDSPATVNSENAAEVLENKLEVLEDMLKDVETEQKEEL